MYGLPHGLVYLVDPSSEWPERRPVSLLSVRARAQLKHLSALVHLAQEYHNESNETRECSYVFPIPARAAVCQFVMIKQDGSKVVGHVKEKQEAKEEYDAAVEEGKLASLLLQETPDTFQMLVGNLLPDERVTIQLEYATELTEDEQNDSIRFHMPMHIGQRYGEDPTDHLSAPKASSRSTFFELATSIESVSSIGKITCPSHTISTDLGPDPSLDVPAAELAKFARVSLSSASPLDKDFILSIVSTSFDAPRCLAEHHPTQNSAALTISFVPRFNLSEIPEQEYLFLVDRSGSMGGDRIKMARKALVVMLRSLPSRRGTELNIISFGSSSEALWKKGSVAYDQRSLNEATKLVDKMQADFGGTEMQAALAAAFKLRRNNKPTALFLLTDGDAWDLDNVYGCVRKAVTAAASEAPLRVFVLGIGNSASTAMCEGIARIGNGTCQFVTDGESFTGKTTRLLKAAKSPTFKSIAIDYGVRAKQQSEVGARKVDPEEDFEMVDPASKEVKPTLSLFDASINPLESTSSVAPAPELIVLAPPPAIQQAPGQIRSLYSGSRLHVYTILADASSLRKEVTLRAELEDGQSFELKVPVTLSSSPSSAIHALAARKLIQELDDSTLTAETNEDERTVKAQIEWLGTTYQLASSQTSFIAVNESGSKGEREKRKASNTKCRSPACRSGPRMFKSVAPATAFGYAAAPGGAMPRSMSRVDPRVFARSAAAPMAAMSFGGGGGALPPLPPAPMAAMVRPMTLISCGPPAPAAGGVFMDHTSSMMLEVETKTFEETDSDRLDKIARAQAFDGSFDASVVTLCELKGSIEEVSKVLGVKNKQVAMVLVVLAFWRMKMAALEEEWEGLAAKAKGFVVDNAGMADTAVEDLLKKVEVLL